MVAPTGLAAVNVGGQTIHSFFGLPPRMIQPDDIRRSRNGRIIRRMKFLIIDEVSMVRSDLMWAIDQSLRSIAGGRGRRSVARLVLFGDLHQLPPVVRGAEEAHYLEETYGGPFFFSVPALTEGAGTQLLELNRVFRQTDDTLVDVLTAIRNGNAGTRELEILNGRVNPIRKLSEGREFVILTPTNEAANRINRAYLDALAGMSMPTRRALPASSTTRRSRPIVAGPQGRRQGHDAAQRSGRAVGQRHDRGGGAAR